MKATHIGFALFAAALAMAACSSPQRDSTNLEARLKEATAQAVPGVPAEQIVISNQSSTAAAVRWRAAAGGKTYDCDADNMVRLPDCRPVS